MVYSLAWRNIWRQPRRTILSATAIALTCIILIFLPAMQLGSYQAMISTSIGVLDGVAQIQAKDYLDKPTMRTTFSADADLQQQLERALPGVMLAKRGNAYALVSSELRSFGGQIIGVQPQQERLISSLPANIKQGRYLGSEPGAGEIVLGATLAKNLQVKVGDRVTVLGTGKDASLAADSLLVVGIFATGLQALDRQLAEMPLSRFNGTFSMADQVHAWVLANAGQNLLPSYPPSLLAGLQRRGLALRDWRAMQPALLNAIKLDISSALAMYLVLIVVIVLSLLNSALMTVLERTREFGMMMALGVKPAVLGRIVWLESLLVMLLGLLLGLVIGAGLSYFYQRHGITFSGAEAVFQQFGLDATIYPHLNWLTLLLGPCSIALCLALAALYPVLRIQKLHIISAMRAV